MDGDIQFQMLDDDNVPVSLNTGIDDNNIDSGQQGVTGFEWRTVSKTAPQFTDEYVARWLHGGCNSRFKRTTAVYDDLGDIADAVFNLDFSVS